MTPKTPTNKGGRPAKSLAEKRKYRLSLKLNTKEYFELKSKAKTAGKNRCDFLRELILSGEVIQRYSSEQMNISKDWRNGKQPKPTCKIGARSRRMVCGNNS